MAKKESYAFDVTLKTKYEAPKEFHKSRTNRKVAIQFSEAHLLLGKKTRKKSNKLSKFITEATKSKNGNI